MVANCLELSTCDVERQRSTLPQCHLYCVMWLCYETELGRGKFLNASVFYSIVLHIRYRHIVYSWIKFGILYVD